LDCLQDHSAESGLVRSLEGSNNHELEARKNGSEVGEPGGASGARPRLGEGTTEAVAPIPREFLGGPVESQVPTLLVCAFSGSEATWGQSATDPQLAIFRQTMARMIEALPRVEELVSRGQRATCPSLPQSGNGRQASGARLANEFSSSERREYETQDWCS
jgi:hypothetical protein